jgi:arsenite methyltransferase
MKNESPVTNKITDTVRSKYAAVAESNLTNEHQGVRAVAEAFGYSAAELASIPAEANMGLSCGNPTALAGLKSGEVVVDLGSGGGLDVFLAARKVGPTGNAIGIDMTPAMIDRARKAAGKGGYSNVEFHLACIDRLPLADASVDCVISNCVINLAPDKAAVFREIVRILKPGGRLAVSDIALKKPLPREMADDVTAYVGCIAGAIAIEDYKRQLRAAGFEYVEVIDSGADLNAYAKVENQSGCCSPTMETAAPKTAAPAPCCGTSLNIVESNCCSTAPAANAELHQRLAEMLKRYNVNDYAASVKVLAVKPRR